MIQTFWGLKILSFFGKEGRKAGWPWPPSHPYGAGPGLATLYCCHDIVEALLKMLECLTTLAVLEWSFCRVHPVLPHDCTAGNTFDCFHNQQDSQKKHRESTESETASSFFRWAMLNTAWIFHNAVFSQKSSQESTCITPENPFFYSSKSIWAI